MFFLNTSGISSFIPKLGNTAKTIVKMVASGAPSKFPVADGASPLLILGNGPSLRNNIDNDLATLQSHHTMAVNFAANAPEFSSIRPRYYVLADPHFFSNPDDPNVAKLITALNAVSWQMTLFIPTNAKLSHTVLQNGNLTVARFPFIAAEGFNWFEKMVFNHRRGMPRPRNVLIPSIMLGIWMGYKKIYLLGADHSWLNTIAVDDDNRVVTNQPHFYKEDSHEQQRIRKTYLNIPLHEVLQSFYIAFRSYHRIERYASNRGLEIINATPGSYIDAFTRGPLPSSTATHHNR